MGDLPLKLTEAQQSRIWAAFKRLNHRLRKKQIGLNECLRGAYVVCARELSPQSAVALVVHYGWPLGWLPDYRQTGRPIRYRFAGLAPAPASLNPPLQPISEAEQRGVIAGLVMAAAVGSGTL
jgi:hypothetical protein